MLQESLRGVLKSVVWGITDNADIWRLHLEVTTKAILGNKLALRLVAVEHLGLVCVIVQVSTLASSCFHGGRPHLMPEQNTRVKRALNPEQLAQWLMSPEVSIVQVLFGDSIHAEVLSRAGDILVFLARMDALGLDHLTQVSCQRATASMVFCSNMRCLWADVGGCTGQT